MEVKFYNAEVFSEKQIKAICAASPVITYKGIFENKKLVDTAGFVPLQVRIKQFLVSGEQSKLSSEMFDSDDWRYMYEHINDNSLEVGDDIEDVSRKLSVVLARQREILARKQSGFEEDSDVPDRGAVNSEATKSDDGSTTEASSKEKK